VVYDEKLWNLTDDLKKKVGGKEIGLKKNQMKNHSSAKLVYLSNQIQVNGPLKRMIKEKRLIDGGRLD